MPKIKATTPSYRRQKRKGLPDLAFIELNGSRQYLGPFNDPATKVKYHRLCAELAASNGAPPVDTETITVVELVDRFRRHIEDYYATSPDPLKEPEQFRLAMRHLTGLYGDIPANQFGARQLKAIRTLLMNQGRSRRYINHTAKRIKRAFKWAASEDMVSAEVWHKLQTVDGLRRGRGGRELEPIKPVADSIVDKTIGHCGPTLTAMIRLQQYTGMRPGELCIMRSSDVDVSRKVWVYTPQRHKTEHHGRERKIFIGPKAQAILEPWLQTDLQAYIFTPEQSESERLDERNAARKTPEGQGNERGTNRRAKPRKKPGKRYNTQSYGRAIRFACRRAWPAPDGLTEAEVRQWQKEHQWTPNQLRHAFATQVRRDHGVDLAGALLGHASASTITAVYAERDMQQAASVALQIG